MEGDFGVMVDRLGGVLPGGAGQSIWIGAFTGFQLRSSGSHYLDVFMIFAITSSRKDGLELRGSFALLIAAAVVAFAFKPGTGAG